MAERGTCRCCGNEYSINADGTMRYHLADRPECHESPGSRKCKGVGQPPAGTGPAETATGYVCRIPAGPEGCGRPVQLTSNGRARSHLDNRNEPCGGGSDWPLKVAADGTRTDTAPGGSEEPVMAPVRAVSDAAPATHTGRPAFHSSADPRDATVTGPVETIGLPYDGASGLGTSTDSYEETGEDVQVECACNLTWASTSAMRAAGHGDMDCDSAPMVPPASADQADAGDLVFDVTHRVTDSSGTEWIHPGGLADCRLPDCCDHPHGFRYGDDGKGHSGSVCPLCGGLEPEPCLHDRGFLKYDNTDGSQTGRCPSCGEEEPDWRTPSDILERMPEEIRATFANDPVCWECGHEVAPLADRFEPDGSVKARHIVWTCSAAGVGRRCPDTCGVTPSCRPQRTWEDRLGNLPRGEFFVRHITRGDGLVFRVETESGAEIVQATVVSAGRHHGRTGELTNLQEEITCTDHNGQRRARKALRRDPGTGTTSPVGPAPQPSSTPSRLELTERRTSPPPAPGSRPSTRAAARPAAPTTSSPETVSGPTAKAATSATSVGRADVTDAFTTAKAAISESDKYDRFGRYKLTHPDSGKQVKWTRATTFAKSVQDTFALSMWSQRMTLKGASMRADIVAAVSTLDVKEDKDRVNSLVEDAKKAAGDKVAANKGTAVHAFTEDRDKLLAGEDVTVRPVPEEFVPTVEAYEATLRAFGLEPVPGLIEFTTAVKQYEVAGTSDRVYKVTRDITVQLNKRSVTLYAGEYVIGDVKGLALTEKIPTPDGWTTMGEVQVGDTVFDAYGQPTRVTVKSRTKRIGTYVVKFDDGSSVTCDTEHIWWTSTGTRPGEPTAKSVQEVIATLRDPRTGQAHHRVPMAAPLELPEADLPIDPYLLGCWLGDGHRRGDGITKGEDLFEILRGDGHVLGAAREEKGDCVTRSVKGLRSALRAEGLQFNKHIPARYLRASREQRTALLRGLMDTDGGWNRARRTAEFSTTGKNLAVQVEELLLSLGQRPHVAEYLAHGFGVTTTAYRVSFTPVDLQPFRLPRKAEQAAASVKPVTRSRRRVIVSVEPGPDVETACIGVDAPTHTYLCGDRMVPTHNTGADLSYGWQEIAIQLALYAQGINTSGVWDWGTGTWGKPVLPDNPDVLLKVRTDVGLVPHLPVDRTTTGAPLATLYAVDLDAGWTAAVLCASVRTWRKARTLATPLEIADVAEAGPDVSRSMGAQGAQTPVSRAVVVSRPVTLEDKARAVTSRAEASSVWKEATAARVSKPELERLTGIMRKKLESFVEQGS